MVVSSIFYRRRNQHNYTYPTTRHLNDINVLGGFLTLEAMLCNKLTSDPMCSKEGIYSIGLRQFKNCVYLVLQFANKRSI